MMKKKIINKLLLIVVLLVLSPNVFARIFMGIPTDELELSYPTGKRTAVLATKAGDQLNNFYFDAPDGQFYAFITRNKKDLIVSTLGKDRSYNEVVHFGFLTVIKKLYYVSKNSNRYTVHIGDKTEGAYEGVGALAASANDQFLAYQVKKGNKVAIVLNGKMQKLYDEVGYPVLSNNGRYAYRALLGDQQLLVVDGVEHSDYDNYGLYSYGQDGEQLYVIASNEEGAFILKENKVLSGPFDDLDLLAVSNDGLNYMAAARQGVNQFAIINGVQGKSYQQVISINISPNGQRFAYGVIQNGQGMYVIDEQEEALYDDLYYLSFSGNSANYRYHAKKEGRWYLINNGVAEESVQLLASGIEQSEDGSILCFWLQYQGRPVLAVRKDEGMSYYRDVTGYRLVDNRLFLLLRESSGIYVVPL